MVQRKTTGLLGPWQLQPSNKKNCSRSSPSPNKDLDPGGLMDWRRKWRTEGLVWVSTWIGTKVFNGRTALVYSDKKACKCSELARIVYIPSNGIHHDFFTQLIRRKNPWPKTEDSKASPYATEQHQLLQQAVQAVPRTAPFGSDKPVLSSWPQNSF